MIKTDCYNLELLIYAVQFWPGGIQYLIIAGSLPKKLPGKATGGSQSKTVENRKYLNLYEVLYFKLWFSLGIYSLIPKKKWLIFLLE